MVDLESDEPKYYETYDTISELDTKAKSRKGGVWDEFDIDCCAIGSDFVAFDLLTGDSVTPVRFEADSENRYTYRFDEGLAVGVRADTPTHVILTGKMRTEDRGKGVFIVVLPIE